MGSGNSISGKESSVRALWVIVIGLLFGAAGCAPDETSSSEVRPALRTSADSLAMQIYEYTGGPEAWHSVEHLRFDFAAEQNGQRQPARRHLWNRQSGDYRIEWSSDDSGTYTALFNVSNPGEGQVFLNGDTVATAQSDSLLQAAHRSFTNDTYWLLAPTKLFDPGVQRSVAADSSTDSTETLHLAFADSVGMTPGDRYWLYADRETGRLNRWRFKLQAGNEGHFRWTGYRQLEAPAGSVRIASRKEVVGSPVAILTDNVRLPQNVPDSLFSSPRPLLQQSGSL